MTKFIPGGPPRFRHQKEGLRNIIKTKGVHALLFDAGTGKTATVLDYASLLAMKSASGEARVLVIAPLAALDTWTTQAEQYVHESVDVWAEAVGGSIRQRSAALASRGGYPYPSTLPKAGRPGYKDSERSLGWRRAQALTIRPKGPMSGPSALPKKGPEALGQGDEQSRLIIAAINHDSFASRTSIGGGKTVADLVIDGVRRFKPDLIVVDESHRIKSPTSNTSRALARLVPLCPRRIILTGTVMPHSPLDVFGQWRFLQPTAFGTRLADGSVRPATFGNFRATYARMGGWMGKEVIGFKRLDEMREVMSHNATVAKKEDVLDLPPVTETVIPVHLSKAEQKAYDTMKSDLAVRFASGEFAAAPNRLAQLMRLRQITSGYLPDDTGKVQEVGESKARTIQSLVQDTLTGEKRIVVFAHFTHEIDLLARLLSDKHTEVEVIYGGTPAKQREMIRRRFGSDDPARIVLVAQVKTMSLAVNELVTASHAIFASLSQQRDDDEQAVARLDRQGQTKPVTIWRAVAPGTVDEVVLRSIRERTDLETAMLSHVLGEDS